MTNSNTGGLSEPALSHPVPGLMHPSLKRVTGPQSLHCWYLFPCWPLPSYQTTRFSMSTCCGEISSSISSGVIRSYLQPGWCHLMPLSRSAFWRVLRCFTAGMASIGVSLTRSPRSSLVQYFRWAVCCVSTWRLQPRLPVKKSASAGL